jgi:hypothetical protein
LGASFPDFSGLLSYLIYVIFRFLPGPLLTGLTAFAGWRIVRDRAPAIKAAAAPIFQFDRSPNPFTAHEAYSPLSKHLFSSIRIPLKLFSETCY